jgi:xanthine phosphoribosyltransferase
MTKKVYYTDKQIDSMIHTIIRQLIADDWKPDYVIGITRGGVVPALMISHYFNIPMHTLRVSLRSDPPDTESNCWMAEDAFGYVPMDERDTLKSRWDIHRRKNILIIDDINDSGATFDWIKQDWINSCLPAEEAAWNTVWNNNVKFAVLVDNESSKFNSIDYSGETINKAENPQWCIFPWECWWQR